MALHITIGYKAGVPSVLYCGNSAHDSQLAYENDATCERYELLRHCAGIRKGRKVKPAPAVEPAEEETQTDETESPAPRRGRPPKAKE